MASSISSIPSEITQFSDQQIHQMNSVEFFYNPGFLNAYDAREEVPENIGDFSLFTMKKVADFVLQNGNAIIQPHGMGMYQPRATEALYYIRGSNDFEFPVRVFIHLFQLTGNPIPSDDPLVIFEHGDKIFESQNVSSAIKAQSIYMAIHDTLQSM
jgi:hypothetical protein